MAESANDAECLAWHLDARLQVEGGFDAAYVDKRSPILQCALPKVISGGTLKFWRDKLELAIRRPGTGAVILLTDGDGPQRVRDAPDYDALNGGKNDYCPAAMARWLAAAARKQVGDRDVSVGVAIACREYENWLAAGAMQADDERLATVETRRDGKGLLKEVLGTSYTATVSQAAMTRDADWEAIASRCRSFRHLDTTIGSLIDAMQSGKPTVRPQVDG